MHEQHTFGGSHLDRYVFDFETAPDDLGGGLVEAPSGGDGGGDAAPWSLSQEEWSAFQEQQAQFAQTVEMLAGLEAARAAPYMPAPTQGNEVPIPDPWTRPDTYEQDLRAWGESLVAPFQERFHSLDQQDGQERLADVIGDLEGQKGEFFPETREAMHALVKAHARELYPQYAARMGAGDAAAEAALEAAFEYAKKIESGIAAAGVSRHTNEISTLAGAPLPAGTTYGEGLRVRAVPDWLKDTRTISQKLLEEAS